MSETPKTVQGLGGPNGGDLLIALMDELGVDTAFGVVSVHNLPIVDAIARKRRFVPVRHEAAAVNAADGYGRARGSIGIAITSTGTGAGNAAGSLIESLSSGSSVLHITGQIDSQYLGQGRGFIHETKDQLAMLQAVSKSAHSIADVASAASVLELAARECLTAPMGPVSVEWPIDLQYATHEITRFSVDRPNRATADSADVAAAAEAISRAKRPLLWVGGGAREAGEQVERLLDRCRAGMFSSNSGRGVVAEGHGACVGNFATSPAATALLERADLLISIGTHFRSNETGDYSLSLPTPHIQIDLDPAAIGRVYSADIAVAGDASSALDSILDLLPERTRTEDGWLTEVAACRRRVRLDMRQDIGWQAEICDAVRSAFPRTAVFARDVTIPASSWGNRLFSIDDPRQNIFPRGGGIGQGLAMGIGASVGMAETPTLVLAGDGGLAVHLGELLTLAQEHPWLVLVVYNDRGYGVLRNTQDAFIGGRSGVDLTTPEFSSLAASCGIPAWRVGSVDEIEAALAEALRVRGPAVVEVDVDALGPTPRLFTPPVHIPGV